MNEKVYAINCKDYEDNNIDKALKKLLLDNHLLDFVYKGCVVAIKTNLVASSKPESAIITNPSVLKGLCKILVNKGANVIIGDSPGGLYNEAVLNSSYHKTTLNKLENDNVKLNHDFSQEVVKTPYLKVVKNLDCCKYLLKADFIINCCKMKTHGMMSLSAAVKNMFGSVPGTLKLEYHYRYNNHVDFANMLIDIQEFYKCKLHLVDAITAMEGNGPTMGTPRNVNLLLASEKPYNLDIVCAKLMNLDINQVVTIKEAINRNLCVDDFSKVDINFDITPYIVKDFKNIEHQDTIEFYGSKDNGFFKRLLGKIATKVLILRPKANKKQCIGCQKCANICPAKAITMKNKKPNIDKKKCIRCFCCQEFCPVGAMKTHKTFLAKIITKRK